MNSDIDRKIAVILVADVVGYSKHMERDENATLKAYAECEKLLKACLKKYKGSIFNTAGDSALAEFPSAVNAVECGVAFQNDIKKRNASDKTEVKLAFRIGINMGDVVKKEGNLFGDGVNIAARLEALAQPNGISISKSVYDLVVPKTKMTFNDLGVQKVKQNEFHAFDILLDPSQKRKLKTKSSSMLPIIGAVAAALAIVVGVFFFITSNEDDTKKTLAMDTSKPVIMVAPIKASGLSEDQKGFARGITESMISTFASYNGLRVLSSSTSYHSEKNNMTDKAIRDEYGVNFIIRGSMQVMGKNARLNLEISDLKIGEIVETKKSDFVLDDIFKVQDELSNQILEILQIDLGAGSHLKMWVNRFDSMEDFTKFLNWIQLWRSYDPKNHKKAQGILEDLRKRYDKEHTTIYVLEAWQISQRLGLNLSSNKEKDLERLEYIINRNVELHPENSDAYNARAFIGLSHFGFSCEQAISDIATAEKNGSNQETLLIGSGVYSRCGRVVEAIARLQELIKIVPNDPGWFQTGLLVTLLYQNGEYSEIYDLIGQKIAASDMNHRVLAIYSILEFKKGNKKDAVAYFLRAQKNGFNSSRLDAIRDENIKKDALKTLEEIEKISKS